MKRTVILILAVLILISSFSCGKRYDVDEIAGYLQRGSWVYKVSSDLMSGYAFDVKGKFMWIIVEDSSNYADFYGKYTINNDGTVIAELDDLTEGSSQNAARITFHYTLENNEFKLFHQDGSELTLLS